MKRTLLSIPILIFISAITSCIASEERSSEHPAQPLIGKIALPAPAPECQVQCNNTGTGWGYTISCPAERPNCVGVDLYTPCEPGDRQDGFCDGPPAPSPAPMPEPTPLPAPGGDIAIP
jgi:hypothetical protein